ncbi:MAG TPA: hypothetical protein VN892_01330 [Solirubrobacteraceae bacterium]|nr:hypothetical protein [Solirubrobacteraceae bacterium]
MLAEVLARGIQVGAIPRAGERHVGALAVGLPAAGQHERALHRAALGLVDVLGI